MHANRPEHACRLQPCHRTCWDGRTTAPHVNRNLLFTLLLVGVTVVWGWTFAVVKDAVAGYGVVSFLAIRFGLGALAMGPFAARGSTRASWAIGAGIGIVLAAGYLFQTFGIRTTTATNSGLITGLFVVFAPAWNRVLFGVRIPRVYWAAVVTSLVGLALLTSAGPLRPTVGDLLTLGCAICFGAHIALLDRHAKGHSPATLALAQLTTAAAIFGVTWPAVDPFRLPTEKVWQALVLTGVVASAGGFYAQTAAQRKLPAIRTALILTLEPVFATFFGWLLAGDRLAALQWVGGGLMVAALLAASLHQPRVPAAPAGPVADVPPLDEPPLPRRDGLDVEAPPVLRE